MKTNRNVEKFGGDITFLISIFAIFGVWMTYGFGTLISPIFTTITVIILFAWGALK